MPVRKLADDTAPHVKLQLMRDPLIWFAAAAGIVVVAFALTALFWRPERNVERTRLGHWFRSLIRLFESDSKVEIRHRRSALRLTLHRRAGQGSECWVVLACPRAAWSNLPLSMVREAIAREPRVLILPDTSSANGDRLDVQLRVPDIWAKDAADVLVRVAQRVLDALGISADARFDLEFSGEQSMERSLEARRRQREGTLPEW
jgi:hypothetical protein